MDLLLKLQQTLVKLLKSIEDTKNKYITTDNKPKDTKEEPVLIEDMGELDLDDIIIEEVKPPLKLQDKESVTIIPKDSKEVIEEVLPGPATNTPTEPTIITLFREVAKDKGYVLFEDNSKDYNVNIWFVRSVPGVVDSFDDTAYLFWKDTEGTWIVKDFPITTDPGLDWLKSPMNKKGTAIIAEGQYRSTHKIDIHRRGTNSAHEALCQRLGVVKVYRDSNRDSVHDMDPETKDKGFFGINFHQPTQASERTGKVSWSSAGCIVSAKRKQFNNSKDKLDNNTIMGILRQASSIWGNSFSITVIKETDLK